MALHDIEIVLSVEGDIQRLVEHAVPLGVVPGAVLTALTIHLQNFAARIELPYQVEETVRYPDIAVAIHPHAVGHLRHVGIEGAEHPRAGRVILHHHDRGIAIQYQKISLRG